MPQFRSSPLNVLVSVSLVTALLYLGKSFLLPLTISILLAFLLAPLVEKLEMWGLGRAPSVIVVAGLAFTLIGLGIYVIAGQLVDLVQALPGYRDTLKAKIFAPLEVLSSRFAGFAKELQPPPASPQANAAMPVEIVNGNLSLVSIVRDVAGPVLAPFGVAAVVLVNVVFFLFDRHGLRDRFTHLVGRGRLHVTTQAIDDAASRVSRYLGAQLIVNTTYGIPVGIALYFIGVPNAALWGLLAIVLRFIPYLGAWIAAAFPIALSIAISPSWTPPLATIALFVAMELFSNNVVEPWLYGASTGLSPSAIIVSATFWTWLWGMGGLLLATPLTVCLAVMGKYIPALGFLDLLLGARPPIAPEHRFYQRLLAGDQDELGEIISRHLARDASVELFDVMILPALHLAEEDLLNGSLEPHDYRELLRQLREALTSIDDFRLTDQDPMSSVAIVPARTESDALAGAMLAFALRSRGIACTWFSERSLASEMQARLAEKPEAVLCLSALTPAAARSAGTMFKRLGATSSGLKLLGFWAGDRDAAIKRLNQSDIEIVTTIADTVRLVSSTTADPIQPTLAAPAAK